MSELKDAKDDSISHFPPNLFSPDRTKTKREIQIAKRRKNSNSCKTSKELGVDVKTNFVFNAVDGSQSSEYCFGTKCQPKSPVAIFSFGLSPGKKKIMESSPVNKIAIKSSASGTAEPPCTKTKSGLACVILVAGHSKKLETELQENEAKTYWDLKGKPKALLPAPGGKCILDYWWDVIKTRKLFSEVYLVTNADKYKHFERWATASDFPTENIINDGSTLSENSLGALGDFELVLQMKMLCKQDVMVIAGDMLFQDSKFDMAQVVEYFWQNQDGDLAIYYEMDQGENTTTRGMVEVCPKSNKIKRFLEKPQHNETSSRFASVVFYCLREMTLSLVPTYLKDHCTLPEKNFGSFVQWLINDQKVSFYGMKLPTGFQLIGDIGLHEYVSWVDYFNQKAAETAGRITKRIYARIGLIGNPSDGFFGKTISLSIKNFWAEVSIEESASLRLIPHPLNDPTEFGSLADLHCISSKEGYLGGLRLLQATCKKFYNYCSQKGIALARRNFTLSYDTNIPRQVGLAGSSAIVTGALKCLMSFYNLNETDIPKAFQPKFILDVEKDELMINAGLQDRVVQVYEGLVYMDFTKELVEDQGHGNYEYLDVDEMPSLFLAYENHPSDSGKIHSNVAGRFKLGDIDVVDGMKQLAALTDEAKEALMSANWKDLAELMRENFALRRRMYGDKVLGKKSLEMIKIGSANGAAVKFPGSGGAVIGLVEDSTNMEQMKAKYRAIGCVVVDILPVIRSCPKKRNDSVSN